MLIFHINRDRKGNTEVTINVDIYQSRGEDLFYPTLLVLKKGKIFNCHCQTCGSLMGKDAFLNELIWHCV